MIAPTPSVTREDAARPLRILSGVNAVVAMVADEPALLAALCERLVLDGGCRGAWYSPSEPAAGSRPIASARATDSHAPANGSTEPGRWPHEVDGAPTTGAAPARESHGPEGAATHHSPADTTVTYPVIVNGQLDGVLAVRCDRPGYFDDLTRIALTEAAIRLGVGLEQRRAAVRSATAHEDVLGVLESMSDVLLRYGANGTLLWAAPSLKRVLGYDPADLVGRVLPLDVVPDSDANQNALSQAMRDGRWRMSRHAAIRHADGSVRWMDTTVQLVRDRDGVLDSVIATMRDITTQLSAEQARDTSEDLLSHVVEAMIDPWVLLRPVRDADGAVTDFLFVDANEAACASNRRLRTDLLGASLLAVSPSHRHSGLMEMYTAVVETGSPLLLDDFPYSSEATGGDEGWYDNRGVAVGGNLSLTWRDVTERHTSAAALAASEQLFRTAMDSASIGMAIQELDGRCRVMNQSLCRIVGRDKLWLTQHPLRDIVDPADLPSALNAGERMLDGGAASTVSKLRLIGPSGEPIWVRAAVVLIRDDTGAPSYFLAQVEDINAEQVAQQQLTYLAFHDTLTGLHNRPWLLDMLALDLRAAHKTGVPVGVLFIDLDNFKITNDSLGHPAGDRVLAAVAERISAGLRPGDHVGRFGGDEFVVVVPGVHDPDELQRVAERIIATISTELDIDGHRIVPSASIGIALSNLDSVPDELLRDSDAALFRAKAQGRARWHFFDSSMHAAAVNRLNVEAELRRAIAHREFVVHYQPIVTLADGVIVGHEALVRWQHPDRGLLTPDAFLAVAEESGLIVEVGAHVLDQVCRDLALGSPLRGRVSVNFSPVQLGRPGWKQTLLQVIRQYGISPTRLNVEITESAALSIPETLAAELQDLRELGMGIHVDDFGTGFSSISLLQDLPVTGLKLDARFVRGLGDVPNSASALASGLAGLAQGLGIIGIAEGVETAEEAGMLLLHGWSHGQGYLFGRPSPLAGLAVGAGAWTRDGAGSSRTVSAPVERSTS